MDEINNDIENLKNKLEYLICEIEEKQEERNREIIAQIKEKIKTSYSKREQLVNLVVENVILHMKAIYIIHGIKSNQFTFPQTIHEKKLFKYFSKLELEEIFTQICDILESRDYSTKLEITTDFKLTVFT